MFIVPLSLFLFTTYLRPRTQAELSYLITAIECLSGLWCLLFAPFQIQLSLVGLVLLRNTGSIKSLLEKKQSQKKNYLDLSDASSPAIDVEATPVIPLLNSASVDTATPLGPFAPVKTPPNQTIPNQTIPSQTIVTQIMSNHAPFIWQHQNRSHRQASSAITVFRPQRPYKPIQANDNTPPNCPIVIPHQLVQLQYRGTTYFKSIPTR